MNQRSSKRYWAAMPATGFTQPLSTDWIVPKPRRRGERELRPAVHVAGADRSIELEIGRPDRGCERRRTRWRRPSVRVRSAPTAPAGRRETSTVPRAADARPDSVDADDIRAVVRHDRAHQTTLEVLDHFAERGVVGQGRQRSETGAAEEACRPAVAGQFDAPGRDLDDRDRRRRRLPCRQIRGRRGRGRDQRTGRQRRIAQASHSHPRPPRFCRVDSGNR